MRRAVLQHRPLDGVAKRQRHAQALGATDNSDLSDPGGGQATHRCESAAHQITSPASPSQGVGRLVGFEPTCLSLDRATQSHRQRPALTGPRAALLVTQKNGEKHALAARDRCLSSSPWLQFRHRRGRNDCGTPIILSLLVSYSRRKPYLQNLGSTTRLINDEGIQGCFDPRRSVTAPYTHGYKKD